MKSKDAKQEVIKFLYKNIIHKNKIRLQKKGDTWLI